MMCLHVPENYETGHVLSTKPKGQTKFKITLKGGELKKVRDPET